MDPALFAENERTAPTADARRYADIGDYTTEGGALIPDVTVAYEEWGSRANPTILVCHALSGDSHATDEHGGGWWSRLVGPSRAIDTDLYHVLCSAVLGGCQGTTGPASPLPRLLANEGGAGGGSSPTHQLSVNPEQRSSPRPRGEVAQSAGGSVPKINRKDQAAKSSPAPRGGSPLREERDGGEGQSPMPDANTPYGSHFPPITVGDMVEVQARLLDHLGIQKLHCVAGGSMGGMQALEWPLRYPDRVERVFVTASAARHSAMQIGFNEVARQAILRDPRWRNGDYAPGEEPVDGLAIARMIGHLTFLSSEAFDAKFGRRTQRDDPESEFAVESYLRYQGEKFTARFDARSLITLTRAIDAYDRPSFAGSKARYLSVGYTSDWIYPMEQSQEIVRLAHEAGCEAEHVPIALPYGHDAFLLDGELQASSLRRLLEETRLIQPPVAG